jgi:tight adherence protein C
MSRRERHRVAQAIEELPDSIELVIVGVRAGLSPTRAVEVAARQSPQALRSTLDEVLHRVHRGQRLADALSAMPEALGPAAAGFADTLATADRYGSPLGPVLDQLADDVRTERRRHAERRARTLPVKLSFPLVMCTLPSFVLLAIVPAVLGALSTLRASTP